MLQALGTGTESFPRNGDSIAQFVPGIGHFGRDEAGSKGAVCSRGGLMPCAPLPPGTALTLAVSSNPCLLRWGVGMGHS